MNYKSVAACGVGLLLPVPWAAAHHSVFAEFNSGNPTELTGIITDMDWINPHSYIYLDVTDAGGCHDNVR